LLIICKTHGTIDLLCSPQQPQSAQRPQGLGTPLTRSPILLNARCL